MTTPAYSLSVTIFTVSEGPETFTYTWDNVQPGNARSNMTSIVADVCSGLTRERGIIHIQTHGIVFNGANVVKVDFEASTEEFQDDINATIQRLFVPGF